MVLLCYFAATYTRNTQCYMSGTSLRTPSKHCSYRFFFTFCSLSVIYDTHAHHNLLRICLPVVPCECDQCAFNSICFGCTLKPDYNELHVNTPFLSHVLPSNDKFNQMFQKSTENTTHMFYTENSRLLKLYAANLLKKDAILTAGDDLKSLNLDKRV